MLDLTETISIMLAYPFQPPKVKFDTKVYHPNVSSQTVSVCLISPPCSRLRSHSCYMCSFMVFITLIGSYLSGYPEAAMVACVYNILDAALCSVLTVYT